MNLNQFKIGLRLGVGNALMLLMMLALGLIGLQGLSHLHEAIDTIVGASNVKLDAANAMRDAQRRVAIAARNTILLQDSAQAQLQRDKIKEANKDYLTASTQLHTLVRNEAAKQILSRIDAAGAEAGPMIDQVVQQASSGAREEAAKAMEERIVPVTDRWVAGLSEIIDFQKKITQADADEATRVYQSARWWFIGLVAGAMLVGAILAWKLSNSITVPLASAVQVARTVANGDLSSSVQVDGNDETAELLAALRSMNENLQHTVAQVRSGSDVIATASKEIASGNADLSERTERQASSLEETASSMEELTATVKQNGEHARQANTLAQSASGVAERGGAVVAKVVDTMQAIDASSRKIVDIISVIDGIAFQTNILALNAAVEAARAGEQGRGFAVVAAEVRNLAQRSASAAKEIKALIDDSVDKVETGGALVAQAGSTMEEIVTSVRRVTAIMSDIAAASLEQEAGIGQINQAIIEMDSVTQQNAALVEQASAAAEAMQDQSAKLAGVVSIFTLAHTASTPRPRAVANTTRTPRAALPAPRAKRTGTDDWEAL